MVHQFHVLLRASRTEVLKLRAPVVCEAGVRPALAITVALEQLGVPARLVCFTGGPGAAAAHLVRSWLALANLQRPTRRGGVGECLDECLLARHDRVTAAHPLLAWEASNDWLDSIDRWATQVWTNHYQPTDSVGSMPLPLRAGLNDWLWRYGSRGRHMFVRCEANPASDARLIERLNGLEDGCAPIVIAESPALRVFATASIDGVPASRGPTPELGLDACLTLLRLSGEGAKAGLLCGRPFVDMQTLIAFGEGLLLRFNRGSPEPARWAAGDRVSDITSVFHALARVLAAMPTEAALVHTDLDPSNVWQTKRGVCLIDFASVIVGPAWLNLALLYTDGSGRWSASCGGRDGWRDELKRLVCVGPSMLLRDVVSRDDHDRALVLGATLTSLYARVRAFVQQDLRGQDTGSIDHALDTASNRLVRTLKAISSRSAPGAFATGGHSSEALVEEFDDQVPRL